ncbi:hypothetical protein [Methylocapsa aurea]|uniref:hypothetical protein n=1 Tax=Methylocapsa aurea TaxID=663610 RepID=UPI003D18C370
MRQLERPTSLLAPATEGDQLGSLLGLIDYLRPEVGAIEPMAEYFLRMARDALLEKDRGGVVAQRSEN